MCRQQKPILVMVDVLDVDAYPYSHAMVSSVV